MWKHYLVTLYRSLARHRLYAALNVLGLAVGIAVFLVLTLDVRFETGFDRWIPHAAETYRLDSIRTAPGSGVHNSAASSQVIAPLLKADYPQITGYTRLIEDDDPMRVGNAVDSEKVYFVDADFFQVLSLPLASGDPATALSDPGSMVISERIARKYFGTTRAVGDRLTYTMNGAPHSYRVSAVLKDLPADTHLKFDVLAPITPAFQATLSGWDNWNATYGLTYVRFRDAAAAAAVSSQLKGFVDRRGRGSPLTKVGSDPSRTLKLELVALPDIHFKDASVEETLQAGVDPRVVTSLGVVGVVTLIIAILNYINLATARSALRAREVAVRKVLGATRATLVAQFLVEAVVVATAAVLIGLALTELALPLVNAAGGSSLKLVYVGQGGVLPLLLGLAILIGLGAGIYPALLLSGFQPAPVLAASRLPGGGKTGARVRSVLVIVQFAAAIAFTISTFVLSAQARYLHDADRGFARDGLILVDSLTSTELLKRQTSILDALRGVPGVLTVGVSDREPASTDLNIINVGSKGMIGPTPNLVTETVGPNALKAYGVALVAGRAFDAAHQLDDTAGLDNKALAARGLSTMLNETAVKTMGFASPAQAIGSTLTLGSRTPMTVIGVVRDVRFMSPHQPVGPVFYTYKSREIANAVGAIRYSGAGAAEMTARLAAAWRTVVPDEPFVSKTADARLADYYVPDQQRARLFTTGALLAVGIGCLGLYGLASFNTARRIKEIGIRKTLGASTTDILRLLIVQFLQPVVIANLVAWPLAFVVMRAWLSGFDQRVGLSPLYFLAATALTLAVALATVIGQALVVARAEPAKALRHD